MASTACLVEARACEDVCAVLVAADWRSAKADGDAREALERRLKGSRVEFIDALEVGWIMFWWASHEGLFELFLFAVGEKSHLQQCLVSTGFTVFSGMFQHARLLRRLRQVFTASADK